MIDLRQKAFSNISRILAITRYDIEQRQIVNDLGLNIHGENYFRDVFNFVYGLNHKYSFENDNFNSQNSACIDLVDKKNKLAYQITTTRTKEKITKTFKALDNPKYKGYTIKVFYLLDKANPSKATITEIRKDYGFNLEDCLIDYTDLINEINNLETNDLLELNEKYFKSNSEKYTDEIVLNLVFKHLITNQSKINLNYDDDFGNVDTREKLKLNELNIRITSNINNGLDFVSIVDEDDDNNLMSNLRSLVIDEFYKQILEKSLSSKLSSREYEGKSVTDLQNLAKKNSLDFNKIINNLHITLKDKIDIDDFNSTSISWIIIAFFFEICDIGIKQ